MGLEVRKSAFGYICILKPWAKEKENDVFFHIYFEVRYKRIVSVRFICGSVKKFFIRSLFCCVSFFDCVPTCSTFLLLIICSCVVFFALFLLGKLKLPLRLFLTIDNFKQCLHFTLGGFSFHLNSCLNV